MTAVHGRIWTLHQIASLMDRGSALPTHNASPCLIRRATRVEGLGEALA